MIKIGINNKTKPARINKQVPINIKVALYRNVSIIIIIPCSIPINIDLASFLDL